jgi:ribonucleotide reductase alpha subunit
MDLDGKDAFSAQYQNANNSVRVTDEFMQAVLADREWELRAVTDGSVIETVRARDLWRDIAGAAWECADPGLQFDTTINRWHTLSNSGPIEASNPCFPGDTLVHTDKGLIAFRELFDRANRGEEFGVYTHDVTNETAPAQQVLLTAPEALMITGRNPIVRLRFANGMELRCTPGHRIFTLNRGYVAAAELTADDRVRSLDLPTPAVNADWTIPVSNDPADYRTKGDHDTAQNGVGGQLRLPEVWTDEFAHYLGWLIGDGSTSGATTATIYGSTEDRVEILPFHEELVRWINDDGPIKLSEQENGTTQLRLGRRQLKRFLEALGVKSVTGEHKAVPWAIEQSPPEVVAAFLRGLFDADGCAVHNPQKGSYVGLGSISIELLRGVQRLLSTFGITSRVYNVHRGGRSTFSYTSTGGEERIYERRPSYDLRITGASVAVYAAHIGFSLSRKAAILAESIESRKKGFYATDTSIRLTDRVDDGIELTYNLSEPRNHSYVAQGIVVRNCSEYLSVNNSACNLASINLLKFLDDDRFDVDAFKHTVEHVFTAQEILVGRSDYPTEKIAENTRAFRQLGLGYANLGALLMALGLPYDSDEGRAWAATITSLMTGHAYATSARTAARIGPFSGFHDNAEPMLRVLGMHRDASRAIAMPQHVDDGGEAADVVPPYVTRASLAAWDEAVALAERHGVRNSQASVAAPTGCLVGGTLVTTDQGLVRLEALGRADGPTWQDLETDVLTDDGPKPATKFFVNGLERVVDVQTRRGHVLRGTTTHRVKVVDGDGSWVWRALADLREGDVVPLALGQMVGAPRETWLPVMSESMQWSRETHLVVPDVVDAELAELVGYFMGDGSLHSRGLRFCVADTDADVADHLARLGKSLFNLEAARLQRQGYVSIEFHSVRLVDWWQACGFAKWPPRPGHSGKGYIPHIPDAILHTNDREIYGAFVRGLFEADGTAHDGYPHWMTARAELASDVQSLLLALGFATTRRSMVSGLGSTIHDVRLLNRASQGRWLDEIGFISERKAGLVARGQAKQSARYDHIPVTRELIDRVLPDNCRDRKIALMEYNRNRSITRRLAEVILATREDAELRRLLGFFYDTVASTRLGDEEFTYDLSVPSNVTYVANGFVSHNTISFMMDCDTTGIEPDLSLVKTKKLVGGGTMSIVNQTIPKALRTLGYSESQVDDIVAYLDEEKSIVGAPHLAAEHLPVFACSMGDNVIHYDGHVRMMGAIQPFFSGALSKCIVGDSLLPTTDGLIRIGSLHRDESPGDFRDETVGVDSLGGLAKTNAFYYGGRQMVRRVELRNGHAVTGTHNHRLLVVDESGFHWRRIDEIEVGDLVASKYGSELWSVLPARFDAFKPSPSYGSQKAMVIPHEMSDDLAYLLGAYASEGCTIQSTWTVSITNGNAAVRTRIKAAIASCFGLAARESGHGGRCPSVMVASKTLVEFLDFLGCGRRASEKRIPDAILRSPRDHVLSFLDGLSLDAYATVSGQPKWAICLDSPRLLDELQAVLANLGVVTGRIAKYNKVYDKSYDEVYATGRHARSICELVPFAEPEKAERARAVMARPVGTNAADIIPISPRALHALVPAAKSGPHSPGRRRSLFGHLLDPRTKWPTRRSVELARIAGAKLPSWVVKLMDDEMYLSPVVGVGDDEFADVYDVSVPTTHAFVANGIVNHNTVNVPEEASVDDIANVHMLAWELGVKAIAVYRDNCKVGQPLSTTRKAAAAVDPAEVSELALETHTPQQIVERIVERTVEKVVHRPVRQKLPKSRRGRTFEFRVADCKGFVTIGEYDDGRPGEVFLTVSKQGSTLSGIMDAFAKSISYGLQYGVPLRAFVEAFVNMRFEPAGMTDDPDIRFASSVMDYLFRRLAVEYMSYEERAELGIFSVSERLQPTLPGLDETTVTTSNGLEMVPDPKSLPPAGELADQMELGITPPTPLDNTPAAGVLRDGAARSAASDAPLCMQCGVVMIRAGSCHACPSCGSTSGCG